MGQVLITSAGPTHARRAEPHGVELVRWATRGQPGEGAPLTLPRSSRRECSTTPSPNGESPGAEGGGRLLQVVTSAALRTPTLLWHRLLGGQRPSLAPYVNPAPPAAPAWATPDTVRHRLDEPGPLAHCHCRRPGGTAGGPGGRRMLEALLLRHFHFENGAW
jgi:hypothetical protein